MLLTIRYVQAVLCHAGDGEIFKKKGFHELTNKLGYELPYKKEIMQLINSQIKTPRSQTDFINAWDNLEKKLKVNLFANIRNDEPRSSSRTPLIHHTEGESEESVLHCKKCQIL